jgi:DedD protein
VNDILKQRLVGALILLALGVVFWPIIFVEPEERYTQEDNRMPPAPEIDSTPIEPPTAEGLRASAKWEVEDAGADQAIDDFTTVTLEEPPVEPATNAVVTETAPKPPSAATDTRGTRAEPPVQPTLDSKGLPVAWILQVASVSSVSKADELRDGLVAMREKAYVKKLERGQKDLYRVYVGPNVERAQLERIQAGIDKRFGVHSIIVRYVP